MGEMFATSFEKDGYDGMRGEVKWWFEAWGSGEKRTWIQRKRVGRPPRPRDLRAAEFITIGMQFPNGHTEYRTKRRGIDV